MLPDLPYEELIAHRAAFAGAPTFEGWGVLPFDGPVLQAVASKGGGALLRTASGELWRSGADARDASAWTLAATLNGAWLLDGASNMIVARGAAGPGVYALDCGGGGGGGGGGGASAAACKLARVAQLEPACAASATGGFANATTGELAVGCAAGLFTGVASRTAAPALSREAAVGDHAVLWAGGGAGGHVAAATADRLHWRRPGGDDWWWEWISSGDAGTCADGGMGDPYSGGSVEAVPVAGAFDGGFGAAGGLWLGHARGLQVMDLGSGALQRFGPLVDGLPLANISALAPAGAGASAHLWVGTAQGGLARRSAADGSWRYYGGKRWLPADGVGAVVALPPPPQQEGAPQSTAPEPPLLLAASAGGLTALEAQSWTLQRKAAHYQAMISPRHDRYGYVADCATSPPGNLSGYVLHDSDNDGLWTSMYAASQGFRYAVTADPAARREAMRRYEALHFLFEAPQPTAARAAQLKLPFPARSAVRDGDTVYSGGRWNASGSRAGWRWKADTSSDEITGHMFAYPVLWRTLGLNGSEAASVRGLVDGLVGGLLENNLTLVDPSTGGATTWGKWSPHWLNEVRDWSDNRGLRALELLSYLAAAEEVTDDNRYPAAAAALRADHGYGRMMVNAKITDPCDDNHSDDEETFLPLYTYVTAFRAMGRARDAEFDAALARLCRVTRREASSLYLAVCALADPAKPAPPALVDNLQGWPLELIKWSVNNSVRDDLRHQPPPLDAQAASPLPSRERVAQKWNGNPYNMDSSNGGSGEADPGAFLLAYWLARHHGLLAAPGQQVEG